MRFLVQILKYNLSIYKSKFKKKSHFFGTENKCVILKKQLDNETNMNLLYNVLIQTVVRM